MNKAERKQFTMKVTKVIEKKNDLESVKIIVENFC